MLLYSADTLTLHIDIHFTATQLYVNTRVSRGNGVVSHKLLRVTMQVSNGLS